MAIRQSSQTTPAQRRKQRAILAKQQAISTIQEQVPDASKDPQGYLDYQKKQAAIAKSSASELLKIYTKRSTSTTDIPREQRAQIKQQIKQAEEQVKLATQVEKDIAKIKLAPKVNYEAAWETAQKHFMKGKAGAYLYHMEKEAREDPQIGAVYNFLKELDKQRRAGNISPGRQPGSLLAKEQFKQQQQFKAELEKAGISKLYDKPLPAFYDPTTGKEILQSIKPDVAEGLGYIPIQVTGERTTGGYVVESPTGLLTPQQQATRQFYGKLPQFETKPLPTTFFLGGEAPPKPSFTEMIAPPTTAYEVAQTTTPYTGKKAEMIEQAKIGSNKFRQKYGYEYVNGQRIEAGGVVPITPMDIASIVTIPKAISSLGWKGITGFVAAEPISKVTAETIERVIPRPVTGFMPSGAPSQIARGLALYAAARNPTVAAAFITSLSKNAVTDPTGTVTELKNYFKESPYEIATMGLAGKGEIRIRERLARNQLYTEISNKLTTKYGPKSVELLDFNKAWTRAFKQLPKQVPLTKKYTTKNLEAVAKGDTRIVGILDEVMTKYKPEVIGSSVILPQTTLSKLPRGKMGDIDIQQVGALGRNSAKMANELYTKLRQAGYNVRLQQKDFFGSKKYHITLNGKELVNIGSSSDYFLRTQHGPLRGLFEAKRFGQYVKDPLTGVRISPIRAQLRVKVAKGYGTGSRPKDVIDALAIVRGTEYLFDPVTGRYIGGKPRGNIRDFLTGAREAVVETVTEPIRDISGILTGRSPQGGGVGYYGVPQKTKIAYVPPKKVEIKPKYDLNQYMKPTKYKKPVIYKKPIVYKKPPAYKKPPVYRNMLTSYTPAYARPKTPYKKPPVPRYAPYNPLTGAPIRPRAPYKAPPRPQVSPEVTNILIPTRKPRRVRRITKPVRKKRKKEVLPTAFESLVVGPTIKRRRAKKKISGFEIFRMIS